MSPKVEFALWSPQVGAEPAAFIERARLAEKLGYHSYWLFDHLWWPDRRDIDCLECLTLLSAIAARTTRIRVGTLVICNSYRNPALLGKSLATIDRISNGRLEVGLGAGWMAEEYLAFGYQFPSIEIRLRQLEEALQILTLMFTKERADFRGRYHTLSGAIGNPKPIQQPRPPILLGGSGEKVMLRLVAKYADRWNGPRGADTNFDAKLAALKEHCRTIGRDFATLTITEQSIICIGRRRAEVEAGWRKLEARWDSPAERQRFLAGAIKGTPDEVVAQLRGRIAKGITFFIILFSDFVESPKLFAREVMPAFA